MLTNPDFKELLSIFIDHEVKYLIAGGYAVMKYTVPRFTKDLDIWISPTETNAGAVYAALKQFGAPLKGLVPNDFMDTTSFYQMGCAPFRLDIIMDLNGLDFDTAWERRVMVHLGDMDVCFISKYDLMISKRLSGRPQDLIDLANLEKSEN